MRSSRSLSLEDMMERRIFQLETQVDNQSKCAEELGSLVNDLYDMVLGLRSPSTATSTDKVKAILELLQGQTSLR